MKNYLIAFQGPCTSIPLIIMILLGFFAAPASATSFLDPFYRIDTYNPTRSVAPFYFQTLTPDAPPVQLAAIRHQTIILTIWATWCAPCLYELPMLDQLARRLPRDQFMVLAVSVDQNLSVAQIRAVGKRLNIPHLTVAYDQWEFLKGAFNTRQLPLTLIIRPVGQAYIGLYGQADWGSDRAYQWLVTQRTALMKGAPLPAPPKFR